MVGKRSKWCQGFFRQFLAYVVASWRILGGSWDAFGAPWVLLGGAFGLPGLPEGDPEQNSIEILDGFLMIF